MKTLILAIFVSLIISSVSFAQDLYFNTNSETKGVTPNSEQAKFSDNLFYGGEFSASFGSYSQVTIAPSIGYKFNNMFSSLLKAGYSRAWESDLKDVTGSTLGYNQFGGSVAIRFAPMRQFYLLLEPAYYSYESPVQINTAGAVYYEKQRLEVPFVYLGAGLFQPIANSRAGITAEIKVDLLNDKNSPYRDYAPVYTVGVVYGF